MGNLRVILAGQSSAWQLGCSQQGPGHGQRGPSPMPDARQRIEDDRARHVIGDARLGDSPLREPAPRPHWRRRERITTDQGVSGRACPVVWEFRGLDSRFQAFPSRQTGPRHGQAPAVTTRQAPDAESRRPLQPDGTAVPT
jgi:hypothetical protein